MVEAQESLSPTSGPAMMKQKRLDRSCMICHRRKIRCDKKLPCMNCVRADVLCYYPEASQSVRRPHKTTIADVSARLARLERTISAVSNDPGVKQDTHPHEPPPPKDSSSVNPNNFAVESVSAEEKLVQGGSLNLYLNEALLSRVLEEEQEIKDLLENQNNRSHFQASTSVDIDPLFCFFQKPTQDSKFDHPPRHCAIQLWQAFVNNVDPLFKIFHIPSIQGIIYGAINNQLNIEPDVGALLFAVYFAGVTSLSPEQVVNLLGYTKNNALNTFKQGLEQSLAATDFLESPTLLTLQAITLYIFCFRAFKGGRALWTLNGLVTRSAQSIGLHRDGTKFKLPPFECEMRRRLWWAIVANDSRVVEDHGLKIYSSDHAIDVALPSNVNDSELYSTMEHLPIAGSKWSDMSFTLIVIEAHNALRRLSLSTQPNACPPTEVARQEAFDTLKARFEIEYLQHCDQNIPIQRMAYLIGKLLPSKLDFVSRQQWIRHDTSTFATTPSLSQTSETGQGTERDLIHACEILEISDYFRSDEMLQGFQWSVRTYPQYHVLIFIFRYLCVAPGSPTAERAWKLADTCFESETSFEMGLNFTVLNKLREKAMRVRDSISIVGDGEFVNGSEMEHNFDIDTARADEGGVCDIQEAQLLSSMNWAPEALDCQYWDSMVDSAGVGNFES